MNKHGYKVKKKRARGALEHELSKEKPHPSKVARLEKTIANINIKLKSFVRTKSKGKKK